MSSELGDLREAFRRLAHYVEAHELPLPFLDSEADDDPIAEAARCAYHGHRVEVTRPGDPDPIWWDLPGYTQAGRVDLIDHIDRGGPDWDRGGLTWDQEKDPPPFDGIDLPPGWSPWTRGQIY